MKKNITCASLAALVLAGSTATAYWWLVHRDLGPQLSAARFLYLAELYGSTNREEQWDLKMLPAPGSAFALVLVLRLSGLLVLR